MMDGRKEFLESLSSLLSLAEVSENRLTREQIRENFEGFSLTEENWDQICRYLELNHIEIEGRSQAEKKSVQALTEALEEDFPPQDLEGEAKKVTESSYLGMYRQELESILPLSGEEEEALFRLAFEEGDEAARNRLAESRLPLAAEIASEFTGQGVAEADLVQEANLAMLLALSEFEGELEELNLHMAGQIRESLASVIEEETGSRNTALYLASQANHLLRISTEIAEETGHEPTVEELCRRMHMTEEAVRELMKISLDAATVTEA